MGNLHAWMVLCQWRCRVHETRSFFTNQCSVQRPLQSNQFGIVTFLQLLFQHQRMMWTGEMTCSFQRFWDSSIITATVPRAHHGCWFDSACKQLKILEKRTEASHTSADCFWWKPLNPSYKVAKSKVDDNPGGRFCNFKILRFFHQRATGHRVCLWCLFNSPCNSKKMEKKTQASWIHPWKP
jgi:hypothetical protein